MTDEDLYIWIQSVMPDADAKEDADLSARAGEFGGAIISYLDVASGSRPVPQEIVDRMREEWIDGEERMILEAIFKK